MTRKTITFAEWEDIQRTRDPAWNRSIRRLAKSRGVPRKVPILADENLETDLVSDLASVRGFKVMVADKGRADDDLWAEAKRAGMVILTADADFWSDQAYPIADSPGVIYLDCTGLSARTTALALVRINFRSDGCMGPIPTPCAE